MCIRDRSRFLAAYARVWGPGTHLGGRVGAPMGPIGPWAVRAQLLGPGPFGPNYWALGRSGPIIGPWAVRAQLLGPGLFGPIYWALGCSGPIIRPWAIRAQLLGTGPFGPINWTLGPIGPIGTIWALLAHPALQTLNSFIFFSEQPRSRLVLQRSSCCSDCPEEATYPMVPWNGCQSRINWFSQKWRRFLP